MSLFNTSPTAPTHSLPGDTLALVQIRQTSTSETFSVPQGQTCTHLLLSIDHYSYSWFGVFLSIMPLSSRNNHTQSYPSPQRRRWSPGGQKRSCVSRVPSHKVPNWRAQLLTWLARHTAAKHIFPLDQWNIWGCSQVCVDSSPTPIRATLHAWQNSNKEHQQQG